MLTLPFSRVYPQFSLILLLLTLILIPQSFSRQIIPPFQIPSRISYSQHCNQILPETPKSGNPIFGAQIPSFFGAYVVNGEQILGPNSQITANLNPRNVYGTITPGVFKIDAYLIIKVVRVRGHGRNLLHGRDLLNVYGGPRFRVLPRVVRFQLSGFWDSGNGELCMVGLGTKRVVGNDGKGLEFDVVFKANYPNSTVITSSLVSGKLESLSSEGTDGHFDPISILGISRTNYEYTLIKSDDGIEQSGVVKANGSLGLGGGLYQRCYRFVSLSDNFELGYKMECEGGRNCSLLDGVLGFLPKFMSLNEIDCTGERMVRVGFGFSETSDIRHGFRQPLDPSRALIAEGVWDDRANQFQFVACRILNFSKSPLSASVGDCSIRVNFTFPTALSVRSSSIVDGLIWSNKSVGEPGYFDRTEIRAAGAQRGALPDMKYEYSETERAKKYCAEKKVVKKKGKSYPSPYSQDMKFDMDVKNTKGQKTWGKAHPVFVGDQFVEDFHPFFYSTVMARPGLNTTVNGLLNITYWISLSPKTEFQVGGRSMEINRTVVLSAEGIYDVGTGRACMIACWDHEYDDVSKLDCDIFIDIQFPPIGSNGGDVIKGSIVSKRAKSDPLYFDHLDLSATSLTKTQVDRVFWRMDFEIAMVLLSNTLTCIFVAVQLFHVKKHPDELPLISILMLVLITLGHMIPLLLNMEAFFLSSPQKRTVFFGSGGWLEVNEVLVRVITMVAFLLEFRLLQLTWSSRSTDNTDGNNNSPNELLWASEKKVIFYSLPLHLLGGLIAWLIQRLRSHKSSQFQHQFRFRPNNLTLPFWQDVKSYAGFMLDAFLLPQVMFNVFSDSKGSALCIPYYFGTTIVRLLPHAYDLFRGHISAWNLDNWYIYANPGMNYYSTAWDILISLIGLAFVVVVYLQQKFGGRSVVPKRYREKFSYEKVPVGL